MKTFRDEVGQKWERSQNKIETSMDGVVNKIVNIELSEALK